MKKIKIPKGIRILLDTQLQGVDCYLGVSPEMFKQLNEEESKKRKKHDTVKI